MDQSNDRPDKLATNDEETGASSGPNHAVPLAWDFANVTLSSNCVFYNNRRAKTGIRGQAAQFGTPVNTRSHSMSTKTEMEDDICILDHVTGILLMHIIYKLSIFIYHMCILCKIEFNLYET